MKKTSLVVSLGAVTLAALSAGCDRVVEVPAPVLRVAVQHWPPPSAAPASAGWPRLLGPNRDGVSAETGLVDRWPAAGPLVLWEVDVGTGYSSPVAVEDTVVLLHRLGNEEHIQFFEAATGKLRVDFAYPTSYVCPYDHYSEGPYSTPLIEEGRVYTLGAQGQLHCLSLTDGACLWQRRLHEDFQVAPRPYPVAASPWIDGDVLVFNLGAVDEKTGIIGLDKNTGETRWTATRELASCATPIGATIHGQRHVFVFTDRSLVSLDPRDGRVRWAVEHFCRAPDSTNATSPIVWNDLVLAVSGPGPGALCLRVLPDGTYEQVWHDRRVLDSQFNSLITIDGFVYGFSTKRQGGAALRCVEFATGRLRWQWQSDLGRGQGLAADGRLLLLGEDGHLAMLDVNPDAPVVRALTDEPILQAPTYSSPALRHGRLYVRNEHKLQCLDLRASAAR